MMDLDLLSEEARREMLACAEEAVPSEMCGVLVFSYEGYEFLPLSNCAENPHETFEISADDWMAAERVGRLWQSCIPIRAASRFYRVQTDGCRSKRACLGFWLHKAV